MREIMKTVFASVLDRGPIASMHAAFRRYKEVRQHPDFDGHVSQRRARFDELHRPDFIA